MPQHCLQSAIGKRARVVGTKPFRIQISLPQQRERAHQGRRHVLDGSALVQRIMSGSIRHDDRLVSTLIGKRNQSRSATSDAVRPQTQHCRKARLSQLLPRFFPGRKHTSGAKIGADGIVHIQCLRPRLQILAAPVRVIGPL